MSHAAITTLHRSLTEWANRASNRKFLHDAQTAQIRAALADPRQKAQMHIAAWMLGTWFLGNGMQRVADGDRSGFDDARTGQALRRCSLLLRQRHRAPPRRAGAARLSFSMLHGAWTALLGLALGDPHAEALYELLQDQPESEYAAGDHLPRFVRELLALRRGKRPTLTPHLGPYLGALSAFHGDPQLLAQRLADLLDHHLASTSGGGTSGAGADFDDPGLKLYPAEVFAIRQVRAWLDLPMPKVDHVLMFTNLGTMSPAGPWPEHELVHRLQRELGRS